MNCPCCENSPLKNESLIENLTAKQCLKCEGRWIPSFQYWKWFSKQKNILPKLEPQAPLEHQDSKAGKFCPECSTYLANRKVGQGLAFTLDHCRNCKGFWFDRGEWESLKSMNLHDEIHFIFTKTWQDDIKEEEREERYENQIEKVLGEDFLHVQNFKAWMGEHEKHGVILNYLQND